jgi:hypothetical protein
MELDEFKQLWRELPEDNREEIRREILSPEVLQRFKKYRGNKFIIKERGR